MGRKDIQGNANVEVPGLGNQLSVKVKEKWKLRNKPKIPFMVTG